jgi:hypothetical protein
LLAGVVAAGGLAALVVAQALVPSGPNKLTYHEAGTSA